MKMFRLTAFTSTVFVLLVIGLGAFTRLADAGLGCPDWPGCYGHALWPDEQHEIEAANRAYPNMPVDTEKTWPEMVHRYLATTLGVLVLAMAGMAVFYRKQGLPVKLPLLLLGFVVLQGLFGMWTVTLKLWPQVVTTHLLGGFIVFNVLLVLSFRLAKWKPTLAINENQRRNLKRWAGVGLAIVVMQIILGGWTTSNYAAVACPDFPTCQYQWIPETDVSQAFNVMQQIGPNYSGGTMDNAARVTIHLSHRIGALLTTLALLVLIVKLHRAGMHSAARGVTTMLAAQILLGVSNVVFHFPIAIAVAHNIGGALLAATMVSLLYGLSTATLGEKTQMAPSWISVWQDYLELTKPVVVLLMLVTAFVGMVLASAGMPSVQVVFLGLLGIALCSAASATVNHVVDQRIDSQMSRTEARPVARGRVSNTQALVFAAITGTSGLGVLFVGINALTAWLTLASSIGYAVIYSMYLKRATPQNIVIGGIAGAAPPLLGWTAVTGTIDPFPLLLVLIIFVWTPPHFWALAIHKKDDYAKVGVPMLPVTHGIDYTKLQILLYTLLLLAATLMPFAIGELGKVYLVSAVLLGVGFLYMAGRLLWKQTQRTAIRTFSYSCFYLLALFAVMLVDHWVLPQATQYASAGL